MGNQIIIVLIVAIALLFLGFLVYINSRKTEEKRVPNYRALFIIGLSWLPIGIATKNPGLWGMGAVFFIVGLANRKKWGQETKWCDLSPESKRIKLIFVGGLTVLLLAAIVYYLLTNST